MSLLKRYLSKTISQTFFPIFLTLFAITSVIFLVKIASLTSVITMNFKELLFLYSLTVPQILFYTLPITFFISVIINLSKLSNEYELIVITSFGLSPLKLLKLLIPISLLMSLALFVISFILIPQADYMEESFMNKKQQEAQFNIKASEYGQKFGPWYIYVQEKKKKYYNDIILFQPQQNEDTFILSQKATMKNKDGLLSLELYEGSASTITNKINQIDFSKMSMNNRLKKAKKISSLSDIINYWKNTKKESTKRRMILQNTFIALLPFISILFYISFGYFNPRYEKNRNTIYAILLVIFYMIVTQNISTYREFYLLLVVPPVWLFISFLFYFKRIKPYY
ncbi:MAG: LptF/LptG family permease [Arcobacteraceae bacterium]|nr:LptF/LptG family permease [Arcobacteraceae bacterium]